MKISEEHIGKLVRARSWSDDQAVKVLQVGINNFRGRRSSGEVTSFDRDDGANPWVRVPGTTIKPGFFENFYILWQPESDLPPKVKFYDRDEAQRAADLMAKKHNAPFYVMKADALCQLARPLTDWLTPTKEKKR